MEHRFLEHSGIFVTHYVLNSYGAFLKHDAGYFYAPCSRKQIDDELLEDLKLCGMSFAKRQAIHKAARLFGGKFYRGKENEN